MSVHTGSPNGSAPSGTAQLPVLFVALQSGRQANGGLQSLTEIMSRLRRVRPVLLTQIESPVTDRWRALGYEVNVWPVPWPRSAAAQSRPRVQRIAADALPLLLSNMRVVALLRSRGIRVVHCNDAYASLLATPSARLAGARVVLNIRDTLLVNAQRWSLMRAMSDRVIVLSEEMRHVVEQELVAPAWLKTRNATPVTAVYSVVDRTRMHPVTPEERRALRRALGIGEEEFAIGVIGALVPKKQQLELLQYLTRNPNRLPGGVKLHFVGDFTPGTDAYCRSCEVEAQRGPLRDRIHFAGYASEIAHWYQALDLTLMVSRFEGLARAMIESVACATPMVAFDFCSAREILERHQCGLVAKQGDFDGLMEDVAELVRNPSLRRQLGERGPVLADRIFSPEIIAARYEEIYLELDGYASPARPPHQSANAGGIRP
jgi:glycosyltransferase involved in cell wall biosynthesis